MKYTWDIDGDGKATPEIDGQLILRWMIGFDTIETLFDTVNTDDFQRSEEEIIDYLQALEPFTDVLGVVTDTNIIQNATIIIKYMEGLRGAALFDGIDLSTGPRTAEEIEALVAVLMPHPEQYIGIAEIVSRMSDKEYLGLADETGNISESDLKLLLSDIPGDHWIHAGSMIETTRKAIDDAMVEIDSYCMDRYTVPFSTPVNKMIQKICAEIAVFYLHSNGADDVPEKWKSRYLNSIKFLQSVASGKVSIGAISVETATPLNESIVVPRDRTFTRTSLGAY